MQITIYQNLDAVFSAKQGNKYMNKKYFLMFETQEELSGYPVFFDYDAINCDTFKLEDDCLIQCDNDIIELRSKNPKLSFDFQMVATNYFFSKIVWEVICDYKSWDFIYKEVVFFGKNKKNVATKEYIILCFKDKYNESKKYIDRLESYYVLPNPKQKRQAELIEPSIKYEVLGGFDILPSQFSGYPYSLVVSEKFMSDKRLKNTKLEFLPIESAGKTLLLREDRIKRLYKMKDQSLLEGLVPIKGEQLLQDGFKEKKVIF